MRDVRYLATGAIVLALVSAVWAANKNAPHPTDASTHIARAPALMDNDRTKTVAPESSAEADAVMRPASAKTGQPRAMPVDEESQLDQPPVSSGDQSATQSSAVAAFTIPWYSINSGSSKSSGGNYEANSTLGQVTVGEASGGSYTASVGYWYGAMAEPPPPCACDCQADEKCDGWPNVFDVVFAVGEAFRSEPYTPDPNPLCPLIGVNDLNLDEVVNVFDIVFLVNMAFRSGLREDNVCDPCTLIGPSGCPF